MRYFIIGFMGSGKTHWGKQWSEAFGISFYDLDAEIEKQEGKTVTALFEEKGEAAFRKQEKTMLHSFEKKDQFILSCGGGTACFHNNMKWMNAHGVTIYLKANAALLVQRLQNEKETRPLIAQVPDHLLEEHISEKLKQREEYYVQAMYHLPAQSVSLENFQKMIRRHG
ncbi:MAG: shikimate kinase [Chitinophagaceae bacterium]|jgi:shikimate kinase|nr:shikimate kinase [Chitinophagaceae bacterium]